MTTQTIDALPASRELDALVGEKVMGLPHIVKSGGEYWETALTLVPSYSTSITAAWEVLEKFPLWSFTKHAHNFRCFIDPITRLGEPANADTTPLAICRAALKAVGCP